MKLWPDAQVPIKEFHLLQSPGYINRIDRLAQAPQSFDLGSKFTNIISAYLSRDKISASARLGLVEIKF
jgi:hypothetical protein